MDLNMKRIVIVGSLLALPVQAQVLPSPMVQTLPFGTSDTHEASTAFVSSAIRQCVGIKADGVTDDSAALAACRLGAPTGSMIRVPHGDMRITSWPATPGFVIWEFDGTTFNGGQPLQGIGTDLIEATINNSKWFTRSSSVPDTGTEVRLNQTFDYVGGRVGNVVSNLNVGCDLPSTGGDMGNYIWCNQTTLTSSATGIGQHVASASTVFRPRNALADGRGPRSQNWAGYFENQDLTGQPSNVSGSMVGIENDIYANGDDPLNYRINLQMMIGKSDPTGTNLRVGRGILIGANDATSFYGRGIDIQGKFDTAAFDLSNSTSMSNAPAIRLGANQFIDFSGANSQELRYNTATSSLEYSASNNVKLSVDNNGVATLGGVVTSGTQTVAVDIKSASVVGLNTANTVISGNAIRLAANQTIALEATGVVTVRYDSTTSKVKIAWGNSDKFSVDNNGNVRALGTITGGVAP